MQKIKHRKILSVDFFIICGVGLTILLLLPVWLVKFPPLQNYPHHLVTAKIVKDYSNSIFNCNRHFNITFSFILDFYVLKVE